MTDLAIKAATATKNAAAIRDAIYAESVVFIPAIVDPATVDPLSPGGALVQVVAWQEKHWWFDSEDHITEPDGISVIVLIGGRRYKTQEQGQNWHSAKSYIVEAPPVSPTFGDTYIVPDAGTGEWADFPGYMARFTSRGWAYRIPIIGDLVYVEDKHGFIHYIAVASGGSGGEIDPDPVPTGWRAGIGAFLISDDSIPPTALIARTWSFENMTLEEPPGSRLDGGTPAMPLGGIANRINDNNRSTVGTTSALGNLTGATVADRIIAQIDYGSAVTINRIEVRGIKASSGASSGATATGIYTSLDGTTWTQRGSGFQVTDVEADVRRTDLSGWSARYIAVVAQGKNWSIATHSIEDLNGYGETVEVNKGVHYVVGASPIGDLSGQTGKIAIALEDNVFTIIEPIEGERGWDKATRGYFRWTAEGTWVRESGSIIAAGAAEHNPDDAWTHINIEANGYTFDPEVAPATTYPYTQDEGTEVTITAANGDVIEFEYRASIGIGGTAGTEALAFSPPVLALFRDAETNAIDWIALNSFVYEEDGVVALPAGLGVTALFRAPVTDNEPHTYRVAMITTKLTNTPSTLDLRAISMKRRYLSWRRRAA